MLLFGENVGGTPEGLTITFQIPEPITGALPCRVSCVTRQNALSIPALAIPGF